MKGFVCAWSDNLSSSWLIQIPITGTATLRQQYYFISSDGTLSLYAEKQFDVFRLLSLPPTDLTISKANAHGQYFVHGQWCCSSFWNFVTSGFRDSRSLNNTENTTSFSNLVHEVWRQASDLQLYWKRDPGIGIFLWILRNF